MAYLIEKFKALPFEPFAVYSLSDETEDEERKPVSARDVKPNVGLERGERDMRKGEPDVVVRVFQHFSSLVEEGKEVGQMIALTNER